MSAARVWACAAALFAQAAYVTAQPQRVVSINLCTDQLALMLAAPGQLISVSRLSHDAGSSPMVAAARALPANGSSAEEVYLLAPDLVLASTFTAPATVSMLRNLGMDVTLFAPADALSDVPERILQMGRALGRETQALALIAQYNTDLAALSDAPASDRPRAALTYVNSFTSGTSTLAGNVLNVAGFDNVATEAGLSSVGRLSLEELILLAPDVIIRGQGYPGHARAEDNLSHPALSALTGTRLADGITDRNWICGTPHVLSAVARLRDLRLDMRAIR